MDSIHIIQRSIDYIEDNLTAEISAEELASQAGFSLFHYYRLFQAAMGMSIMHYILRRRLLHGIYAIRCGMTKTDAAFLYGFDTYAGFYKAFLREFGCTPSNFLKTCRTKCPYRIDLQKEQYIMVTHKRVKQILSQWGLADVPIMDIYHDGTGARSENALAVGQDHILKFHVNLGKVKTHIELSRAISCAGLRAAVPVPALDGSEYIQDGEFYYFLTNRLKGEPLRASQFYDSEGLDMAHSLGGAIGRLHLVLMDAQVPTEEADLLSTVKNWALPAASAALGLTPDFCRDFLTRFESLYPALPRQIIRRDPNPGNVILDEMQWGFLDFELSECNARIYDPCYAATAILSESFDLDHSRWLKIFRSLMTGYDEIAKLTDEEREAIPYIVLSNQLVCVAWFSRQEKYKELLQTNVRMTQWLISVFDQMKI